MENISTISKKVKRATSNQLLDTYDELAIEEPLEVQLFYGNKNNLVQKTISITMRTPGHDEELTLGFLFTEGIIQNKNQIAGIYISSTENKALITLNENEQFNLQKTERNFYTTSSCGVCGKTSIEAIKTISLYKNTTDEIQIKAATFYQLEKDKETTGPFRKYRRPARFRLV